MNKIYNPNKESWPDILKRPTKTVDDIESTVYEVFSEVLSNGDRAVSEYTVKFDGVSLDTLLVTGSEVEEAKKVVSDDLKHAIQLAKSNIEKFHAAQKTNRIEVETVKGVKCWQEK